MSVISSWEAVPSRIVQMWDFLVSQGEKGIKHIELINIFSPSSLHSDDEKAKTGGAIFTNVRKECLALGLIGRHENEDEEVLAAITIPPENLNGDAVTKWYADHLFKLLTSPSLAADRGQEQVPFALAWISLQSPAIPLAFSETQAVALQTDFPNEEAGFSLKNFSNLQQAYYWARYLGFCTFSSQPKQGGRGYEAIITPDATGVLRRLLPLIFEDESRLSARDFLMRLGQCCPVLERGEAREHVVQAAVPGKNFPDQDIVSGGTSLGIKRLQAEGLLHLEDLSDAVNPGSLSIDGKTKERFSHIGFIGDRHDV